MSLQDTLKFAEEMNVSWGFFWLFYKHFWFHLPSAAHFVLFIPIHTHTARHTYTHPYAQPQPHTHALRYIHPATH